MIASEVKLSDLKTWDDCNTAIRHIESDWRNSYGGLRVWNSGVETHLKKTAKKKIKKIEARAERLSNKALLEQGYTQEEIDNGI